MISDVDRLHSNLLTVMTQGERAMAELGWTMANVAWRETLDHLVSRLTVAETRVAELEAQIAAGEAAE